MNFQDLIKKALKKGFSDIEIYEESSTELSIGIFNGVVDKNELSDISKLAIRAIYNGKMAYMDLENKNESIDFILDNLMNNAKSITTEEEFLIFEGSKSYPSVKTAEKDFDKYTNFDKINLLKTLEKNIKEKDTRVIHVPYCNYQETLNKVRIINSKGLDIAKQNDYCVVFAQVVAKENNDSQSSFEMDVKLRYEDLDIEKVCKDAVEKAVSMLNAKPVPSKTYPTIIEKEAMTSLFSSFQSMFSGESAIKKITPLLGKLDTLIMDEKITIVDDPIKEDAIIVSPFDDEGVACYRKEVVKDGVFKTFLHNLKTANYFKTTSTGNGFKTGATIGVSGANLYIAPGSTTKEEMIKDIEEGLLLTSFEGLHAGVNPISGDFSLKASGFLIQKGDISRAVTLIVASGNFFKLMKEVEIIGNDLELGYRGIGSPSIKFKGIAISGE